MLCIGTRFERLWGACDNLLLIACCVLLGVWIGQSALVGNRGRQVAGPATETAEQPVSAVPARNVPSAGRVVNGVRVSLDQRDRMSSIAKSLADPVWERAPACPAMDMREDGKSFEIVFALPEGVDDSRVKVSAQGNILTLAMVSNDGTVMMERFRIPCGVERGASIETAVSNDVLRVRIPPLFDN